MRVIENTEIKSVDLQKKHLIEVTNAELATILSAFGSNTDMNIEETLGDLDVYTMDLSTYSTSDELYDDILELLKKENIVQEDW
ncbi:hypothetical protein E1Z16_10865 [Listeria monocytogenes]|uniref:hypothetical protein n=1 Tax=Listeria TaxID=1637 RepID=UPI000BE0EE92|nr:MULTISPECIES: hypothetical protein [Listeria]EAC2738449.1 hypothetical protein [Listeria monocytogenes]EAD0206956.1 hypothetical protein [Listeria monocytogenes]EAD0226323.1 hypothetical protein [Listeria monocytogenes]EAD6207600.1 hypothetical protein [Listeria monocytogenes]EAD6220811.1 hypothetical protein [Listeria monocytogenes]